MQAIHVDLADGLRGHLVRSINVSLFGALSLLLVVSWELLDRQR